MDLSHQGHTLSVLPTLVYGDPPMARVSGDEVTPLGDDVPVRRREEERELAPEASRRSEPRAGRRVDLDGCRGDPLRPPSFADWQKRTGDDRHARVFDDKPLQARLEMNGDAFDVVFEQRVGAKRRWETTGSRSPRSARTPRR